MPKKPQRKGGKKKKEKPKKLDLIEKEWAEQTPEEQAHTVNVVCGAFKELDMKGIEVVVGKESQIGKSTFSAEHLSCVGSCSEAQGTKLQKYVNLMDAFDKFDVKISGVVTGVKMPFLVSAYDLEEKEVTLLEDRRGKVVFLQFWAPWNKKCREYMSSLMALAEKKKDEWEGKVEILCIACDTTIKETKEVMKEKAWKSSGIITLLWSGEDDDEDEEDGDGVVSKYEIESLPEVFLVDGDGVLVKRVDSEDIVPETAIERVLGGDKELKGSFTASAASWQTLEQGKQDGVLADVKAILDKEELLGSVFLVTTEAKIRSPVNDDEHVEKHLMVVGKVDISGESLVKQVVGVLESAGIKEVDQTVVISSPATPINPASTCAQCSGAISDKELKFHCAMCVPGYTICAKCEPNSTHPHYHPLFRIGPNVTKNDLLSAAFSIGSFQMCPDSQADSERIVHDGIFCNNCKVGPISGGPRWKCCSCEDYDLCTPCYNTIVRDCEATNDSSKHETNHFFLRVLDSALLNIDGEDDEGDEGEYGDFDGEDDMAQLVAAMAEDGELDGNMDVNDILAKLRGMGGDLEEFAGLEELAASKVEVLEDENEVDVEQVTVGLDDVKLGQLAQEAAAVPLPDDDDDF